IQAQKVRLARTQGPYYGGSLPNVNQIGRTASELQGSFPSPLDSSRSTRHHGLVERVHRDRHFISPSRPYRRHVSFPGRLSCRNWNSNFETDKSQIFQQLPSTALNRTNSDSALHTSVMNPPAGDPFTAPGRRSASVPPAVFSYPAPIEEHRPDDGRLKPWDSRKLPQLSSRPKSCEVPGITAVSAPGPKRRAHYADSAEYQAALSGRIRPEPAFPSRAVSAPGPKRRAHYADSAEYQAALSGRIRPEPAFPSRVFPSPDQQGGAPHGPTVLNTGGSLPDLSSLHFPSPLPTPLDPDEPGYLSLSSGGSTGNLSCTLTQLGIHSPSTFHSTGLLPSLQGTSSNPSLQSSLSNPNIQSSLSSHSFHNSLSSASLHSSLSNPSLQSSLSSSPSLRSSFSSQSLQSSLSNSSLSSQSLQSAVSNTYSASGSFPPQMNTSPRRRAQLTPGVALDTSRLQMDQRFSPYSFGQQQAQKGPVPAQTHALRPSSQTVHLHLHNMQNLHKTQNVQTQPLKWPNPGQNQNPDASQPDAPAQTEPQTGQSWSEQQNQPHPSLRQNRPAPSGDLDLYNAQSGSYQGQQTLLEMLESSEQQTSNQNQNQNQSQSYTDGRQPLPNIILTGEGLTD
ncbi:hypothetical protein cypCar_00046720, partial [Cyprinus carpio]